MPESRSYSLPSESIPSADRSHTLADLLAVRSLLHEFGIRTENTRIERYIRYTESRLEGLASRPESIFRTSVSERLNSELDWDLYLLRESSELAWIVKGIQAHIPKGVVEKLRILVGGRDFAFLDADSRSRDAQFELRIASYFCQSGFEVDLSLEVDIVAILAEHKFIVECKRVAKQQQVTKRIREANKQIKRAFVADGGTGHGIIAIEVTKVAFPNDGLIVGVTSDHTRDSIQDQLIKIGKGIDPFALTGDENLVLSIWLQIHIPVLITHPATEASRFSSYHLINRLSTKNSEDAFLFFRAAFEFASKRDDPRATPAQTLTRRRSFTVPAGSKFGFDQVLLGEIFSRAKLGDRDSESIVGMLEINGQKHEFSFLEFSMLPNEFLEGVRTELADNVAAASSALVCELYLRRIPYEEA